jgi:5'-nucleotidase
MDGVLADFDAGFERAWKVTHPDAPQLDQKNRHHLRIIDEFLVEFHDDIERTFAANGFYRNLPLVEGADNILSQLTEANYDVWICTRPLTQYRHCVLEKYEWIDAHYGQEWTKRIIITRDKTLLRGDLLVDDMPLAGSLVPMWKQVLFDTPYNEHIQGLPRMNWNNWRSVLGGFDQGGGIHSRIDAR